MTATVRELAKELVVERPRAIYRECAYCGRHCVGFTCAPHRDLPQLEHDIYSPTERQEA